MKRGNVLNWPILQPSIFNKMEDKTKKRIRLKSAKIGMCLAETVRNKDGTILIKKGMYLTSKTQIIQLLDEGIREIIIDLNKSLIDYMPSTKIKKVPEAVEEDPENIVINLKKEIEIAEDFYKSSEKAIENLMSDVRMGRGLKTENVDSTVKNVIESIRSNYQALLSMASLKAFDEYTFAHSVNVMVIALTLAKHLDLKEHELEAIGRGALLHDIGKAKIPLDIINKPSKLTNKEFRLIKTHPVEGRKICLDEGMHNKIITDTISYHHESYDGSGYPHKLKGRQISKYAAIVSIADFYDALTTVRSYKKRISPPEAINIIFNQANTKFDRRLVNHFIKTIGIYPVGSLVKLGSGRIAVIVGFARGNLIAPIVKIVIDENNSVSKEKKIIDLSKSNDYIKKINPEIDFKIKFKDIL